MIEFLPPRDDAFGSAEPADFVGLDGDDAAFDDGPPRSRWPTVVAALGVAGLVTGGVIAAAPWEDTASRTPPVPSTSVPSTSPASVPASATVDGRPPSLTVTRSSLPAGTPTEPAGWVPDEGSGWAATYGWTFGDRAVSSSAPLVLYTEGDGELTRTSGRWVAVVAGEPGWTYLQLRAGGVEVPLGERRMLVSTAPDGLVRVEVAPFPGLDTAPITVTGHGVELGAMLEVAAGVGFEWRDGTRGLDLSAIESDGRPTGALDGFERLPTEGAQVSPFAGLLGVPLTWTDLADGRGRWARAGTFVDDPVSELVARLLLTRPLAPDELTLDVERRIDDLARRGLRVQLGRLEGNGLLVAGAAVGDGTRLSVIGGLDPVELLDLVAVLRPAGDEEWLELMLASADGGLEVEARDPPAPTLLGAAGDWSAEVVDGRFSISAGDAGVSEPFVHGQGPELVEYRTFGRAFLRATTTFPSEARSVSVVQDGREIAGRRLQEIRGTGVLATVVEIDPALPVSVTWFDGDGVPLAGPATTSTPASGGVPGAGSAP